MREMIVFEKRETLAESIASDVVTFGFLVLCMWFSYSMGGGWWTFFTCVMFLGMLTAKLPNAGRRTKLTSKKDAVKWAESLPDDEAPNAK